MPDPKSSITKVTPTGVPAYLAQHMEADHSLDAMKEYRVVPRLKIVQSTTDQALKTSFGEGSVVLAPSNTPAIMMERGQTKTPMVTLVPVFFFNEFCTWKDLKDKNNELPKIIARSYDKASEIAIRANDPNKRIWKYNHKKDGDKTIAVPDPNGSYKARDVNHLNFLCIVYEESHPLKGQLVTLSFARGEFGQGRNFISAVSMRRIPLWSQVWAIGSAYRDRGDKKWFGWDYAVPGEGKSPNIKEEEVQYFMAAHNELAQLHRGGNVVVDRTDEEATEGDGEDVNTDVNTARM